ncbi:hypothetical protein ACFQEX_23795 [Roseibium salinum]|uniref:hypothetical protein n=1 Tax=Roseibium salinum TaxID=1604349 RepID=UPI003606EBAF
MGRGPLVGAGVVQHQIFEVDQLAVEGHGGAGVEEVRTRAKPFGKLGAAPEAFVSAGERAAGAVKGAGEPGPGHLAEVFPEIVSR